MLFRNYPRDFRYQFFSRDLPRGASCFICRENVLTGLEGLPSGGSLRRRAVPVAPSRRAAARRARDAARRRRRSTATGGVDVKWIPNPDTRPRPRRSTPTSPRSSRTSRRSPRTSASRSSIPRSGRSSWRASELFSTPIQAVYTRTITSPRWGVRGTGKSGDTAYTALVARRPGRRQRHPPGPRRLRPSPIRTSRRRVAVARVRHDVGNSFVEPPRRPTARSTAAATTACSAPTSSGGRTTTDTVTGQLLFSSHRDAEPARPRRRVGRPHALRRRAGLLVVAHHARLRLRRLRSRRSATASVPTRASCPRSASARCTAEAGYTWHPTGFFSQVRTFAFTDPMWDNDGGDHPQPASRPESAWTAAGTPSPSSRSGPTGGESSGAGPSRDAPARSPSSSSASSSRRALRVLISQLSLEGAVGEEIDFDNARPGHGATLHWAPRCGPPTTSPCASTRRAGGSTSDPTAADPRAACSRRGSSACKATYTFNARSYLRADRPVRAHGQRSRPLPRARRRSAAARSPAQRSSPTSSTGSRCCSSATATRVTAACHAPGSSTTSMSGSTP